MTDIARTAAAAAQALAMEIGVEEPFLKLRIAKFLEATILGERERCAEYARAHLEDIAGCDMLEDEPERISSGIMSGEEFVGGDDE